MKIKTRYEIQGLDGQALKDDDGKPITLRTVIQNALLGTLRGDEALDGSAKLKLWLLAQKAQKDTADFDPGEEIATIKERIGKAYGPAVVGPAFSALDGNGPFPTPPPPPPPPPPGEDPVPGGDPTP